MPDSKGFIFASASNRSSSSATDWQVTGHPLAVGSVFGVPARIVLVPDQLGDPGEFTPRDLIGVGLLLKTRYTVEAWSVLGFVFLPF